jgi:hypothetical protein
MTRVCIVEEGGGMTRREFARMVREVAFPVSAAVLFARPSSSPMTFFAPLSILHTRDLPFTKGSNDTG